MDTVFDSELPAFDSFQIPRHLHIAENTPATLIGFGDASERGYGAAVYIRTLHPNGDVKIALVCAKTKIAPLKIQTIPRLELCAAHLLAKLLNFVVRSMESKISISKIFALTDSSVVMDWIIGSPHRWKIFVANRVVKIHELVPPPHWFHIDGKNNIADCLSRSLSPSQLIENSSWFSGPEWLYLESDSWPLHKLNQLSVISQEEKSVAFPVTKTSVSVLHDLMLHFSSWSKLCRAVGYVLRFLKIIPKNCTFSPADLVIAETYLLREIQLEEFVALRRNKLVPSSLRTLCPFIKDGLVRVGGRLNNSNLSYEHQHPILLPKKHHVVQLLIDFHHKLNFHAGSNLLLSLLRQKYWVVGGRSVVRNYVKNCNHCFRSKPRPTYPLMADLPAARFQEVKPFLHTGVDFAGPFSVTISKHRGVKTQKAYLCLFVCMSVKALHLELASELSSECFLNCFKRFLARRGPVIKMFSDRGTNFVGAKHELDSIHEWFSSQRLHEELTAQKIHWSFNPPHSPHMGGLWESNIKSVKTHLFKVIGQQILTFEELYTIFTQIEAILNSRPLCWLSSDPNDPAPLTPAHFLNLSPLKSLPAIDVLDVPINRLTRKQLLDQLVQSFWQRWRVEYLHLLQTRQKWYKPDYPISVGMLVLVLLDNVPPLHWPLGVIEKVFPGKDNIIRTAQVRYKNNSYVRPVIKLCPLPTQ